MTKRNRFRDALLIQEGACNLAGIARTLVKACDECIQEGVEQRNDPAVRLIVHQMAHLTRNSVINDELWEYSKLMDACKEKAE